MEWHHLWDMEHIRDNANMSRRNAWVCANCTYRHDFPGPRCVMCGELRNATRQQMRDFVAGKTLKTAMDDDVQVVEMQGIQDNSSMQLDLHANTTGTCSVAGSNSVSRDKENQKQPTGATANAPILTNPYTQSNKQRSKNSSTTTTKNNHTKDTSTSVSTNHDSLQQGSTGTYPFNTAPLHPTAPPRQSPVVQTPEIAELPKKSAPKTFLQNNIPLPTKIIPYSKGPVAFCPQASKTWIYPKHPNYPPRQYQLEITAKAVHHNTLVSLPTGLGKTIIAAVVMYNYWRWFPSGKVIFLAPTLPLVNQQVQACYKIMGFPAAATAVLTGKLSREKRLEYWKERRVFYCTPQTVQKDLIESHEFAPQVVCLVLDEAHKATGDYAYVKVIEQLEAAGAKFRIVGLSATPGTSIKAIQQVVHALRSHCIEARHEAHPTVQPYLHEKVSEIVIVPRNDSQRQVERHLTNMLTPILEQLRQMGAIRLNGNSTLTPFQIFQAKKDFTQRQNGQVPGHVSGLYAVAHKLVEIRNDAHQSLGVVRTKLFRLRNEPQRGMLSKLVKSEEFQDLIKLVQDATGDNPGTTLSQQQGGTSRNNPKLTKLAEILKEHFCRAQACGKSSRVIVFSQFRDSVAEIVLLLRTMEPTIRPHHFVGQGKPPKGHSNKTPGELTLDGVIRLNGMKQSEQQKVIQDFRNDKYNVLVCTCIGEEGLDIGEVDLIVNYDTLRSPIRMIQRTGRTGRARDGRVVCLIAEGQEQRTYEQSKQAEKTLMRALEKKSNFVMHPDVLLFPTPPHERQFLSMQVGSQLHLSQVAGAQPTSARKTNGSKTTKFKLGAAQEQERQQRLGSLVLLDNNEFPWRTLRRFLVRHRSLRQSHGGRTIRILQALEHLGPIHDGTNTTSKVSRIHAEIHSIFPLDKPLKAEGKRNVLDNDYTEGDTSLTHLSGQRKKDESITEHAILKQTEPNRTSVPVEDEGTRRDMMGISGPSVEATCHINAKRCDSISRDDLIQSGEKVDMRSSVVKSLEKYADDARHRLLSVHDQHSHGESDEHDQQTLLFQHDVSSRGPEFRLPTPPPSSSDEDSSDDEFPSNENQTHNHKQQRLGPPKGLVCNDESQPNNHVETVCNQTEDLQGLADVTFCLPTQSSSSEDEDSSDEVEKRNKKTAAELLVHPRRTSIALDSEFTSGDADPLKATRRPESMVGNSLEGDSDDEDFPLASLRTKKRKLPRSKNKSRKHKNDQCPGKLVASSVSRAVIDNNVKPRNGPPVPRNDHDTIPKVPFSEFSSSQTLAHASQTPQRNPAGEVLQDSPDEFTSRNNDTIPKVLFSEVPSSQVPADTSQTPQRNPPISVAGDVLQDTPDDFPSRIRTKDGQHEVNSKVSFSVPLPVGLTDTPQKACTVSNSLLPQLNADDFFCQICCSLESLDHDPIILCDSCELGFHKSCYDVEANIESVEPWYCDLCKSKVDSDEGEKICILCSVQCGPIKRYDFGWCHPICRPFWTTSSSSLTQRSCFHCLSGGGARCFSCAATMHPCCAIYEPQRDHWTVVIVESSGTVEGPRATLFCPQHVQNVNIFLSLISPSDKPNTSLSVKIIQTKQKMSHHDDRLPKLKQLKRIKVRSSTASGENKRAENEGKDARTLSRFERVKRRRLGASKFILEEAEIDSDDDMDGDEEMELQQLEEDEMSHDSFINDSTELTQHFSQDNLAEVDPDATAEVDFSHHRALDAQRELQEQFQTPILNRRMKRVEDSQLSSSSQKGVGNMHFVRSVLEHHRQGGRADEIEEYFRHLEREGPAQECSLPHST